jgi:hypothetical protein
MLVCSLFPSLHVPERHDAKAPDTGRDRRVTTQVTTQNLVTRSDCHALHCLGDARVPGAIVNVLGRVQKKLRKMGDEGSTVPHEEANACLEIRNW